MSELRDGLAWSGEDLMLSLFVIHASPGALTLSPRTSIVPNKVLVYEMLDDDNVIPGRRCDEYDLVFDLALSDADVESVIRAWLDSAMAAGAILAWFGFEGSFSFTPTLSSANAHSFYAVANQLGLEIALDDDYRASEMWSARLDQIKSATGLEAG